jgi:hypothetical protein
VQLEPAKKSPCHQLSFFHPHQSSLISNIFFFNLAYRQFFSIFPQNTYVPVKYKFCVSMLQPLVNFRRTIWVGAFYFTKNDNHLLFYSARAVLSSASVLLFHTHTSGSATINVSKDAFRSRGSYSFNEIKFFPLFLFKIKFYLNKVIYILHLIPATTPSFFPRPHLFRKQRIHYSRLFSPTEGLFKIKETVP